MTQTRAFGIDISRYQRIDWDVVAPNVDFVWAKCSEGTAWKDPAFADNVQACYDRDVPIGAYHYFITSYYTQFPFNDKSRWPAPEDDAQLQNLISALKHKKFYFLAIDIEETGNKNQSPSWISEGAKIFAGRVQDWLALNHPGVPLFIYTRNTYIAQYAPSINDWIGQHNSWIAQWTWNKGSTTVTWEQARATMPVDTLKPKYFSNRSTWEMWQYSGDRFIPPGIYNDQGKARTVDLDVFNGTKEDLYRWIKFTPRNQPEPEPQPDPDPVGGAEYVKRTEYDVLLQRIAVMESEIDELRSQAITDITVHRGGL